MPWYRLKGMNSLVHVRGTRLPQGCGASVGVQASDGAAMQLCLAPGGFQCDWPMPNNVSRGRGYRPTCDRHLCPAHAHQVGPDKHYCPEHFQEHADGQEQPGLFTELLRA